jgi:hypothetical protein
MPLSDQQQLSVTASATSAPAGKLRAATPVTIDAKATAELFINLDAKRVGASVFNSSNAVLWIDYSADVSPTQHLVPIGPGQLWESSTGCIDAIYGRWGTPPQGETLTGEAHVRSFVIR